MATGNTVKDGTGTEYHLLLNTDGRLELVGAAAHDAAASGNPVQVGGVYRAADPSVADGDVASLLADIAGRLKTLDDGGLEIIPLISAARVASTNSADLTNPGAKGVRLTLDFTVQAVGTTLTLHVDYKDPASGKYEEVFSAAAALGAVGTATYDIFPGDIVAADDITEVQKLHIGRTWRVRIVHSDADSCTYSVGACYLI